ncbi:MAG: methyltransferase domain-containing protein [Deltaproteobacteria bacterium]|nr:methyltransferase domain-containing protein [Deltaproteobacteria bacterium]MCW5801737.1 methyltransferase domain-containing protein [Deltaproteobacteria bacterium]
MSDSAIWDVWLSAFHAPALAVADDLGMFAALARAPATSGEVATALHVEARAADTLLGLMASLGFLTRLDGRFHLTDVARTYLLPESPYYWGGFLRRIRDNPIDCKKIADSLRRGTAMRDARVTGELWGRPQPPPEALRGFTHAMHAHSFGLAVRVCAELAVPANTRLLDVGGGSGSYSIALALHDPTVHCTVLDFPAVCEVAQEYAARNGVAERLAVAGANMFVDAWPGGFDRVFFSDILHDWADEECRRLVERAHGALRSGGRIMIHEMLLADTRDAPLAAITYSTVMVFVAEGRQRTAREIVDLLAAAGFVDVTVRLTSGGYALLEGTRP